MADKIDYGEKPITVNVRGIESLQAFLKTIPRGTIKSAIAAASEYLIGNERHGLSYYPARVQHGEGNPYQWQSEKQRRAYFATDGFGAGIPYRRTGDLGRGWEMIPKQDGYQMQIVNRVPYADFVQGVIQQRGHYADKWRKARDIVSTNMKGALQAAQRAVDKWIREHK